MSLHHDPARPLTSREISKVISSMLFGLAEWCDPKEIIDAINHFHEHIDTYKNLFEGLNSIISENEFMPSPTDEN